jgi:hypothetical protein
LVAALLLAAALVASFLRARAGRGESPPPLVSNAAANSAAALTLGRPVEQRAPNEPDPQVVSEVSALASAVKDLANKKAALDRADTSNAVPPPASAFPSPTACMQSYLPEVELAPGGLEFVCKKSDLWAIDREALVRIAARRGKGAELWKRLGHYSLATLAVMRSGCCADAEPLRAVVPGLWCGILRDKVRALAALPDSSSVRAFDETMTCLEKRRARVPEHWSKLPAATREHAFDEVLRRALERARVQ